MFVVNYEQVVSAYDVTLIKYSTQFSHDFTLSPRMMLKWIKLIEFVFIYCYKRCKIIL